MDLHIKDRLIIPTIFPSQGNFMDYNVKKAILNKIALAEKDKETYSIVEKKEEGRIEWDLTKDIQIPLAVEFTADEVAYMRKACENMADKTMPDDVWQVVERLYNEL